jgi:hypothetical protein
MDRFDVVVTANVGFPITGAAFSNEEYPSAVTKVQAAGWAVRRSRKKIGIGVERRERRGWLRG